MQQYNLFVLGVLFFFLYISIVYLITFLENKSNIKSPKLKKYPLVTVIVPAYNEENTISKTLNSLLNQNYPKEKLEIIVVDNNSTDNTFKVAKKYEKQGVIIIKEKKPGKGAALNAGLKICKGDIIGGLDSDSFVLTDAIRKMVAHFEKKEVICVTPSIKIWKAKNWLEKVQHLEYLSGAYFRKMFSFLGGIPITAGPLTMYKTAFVKKTGGWDENTIGEDIELTLRVESQHGTIENAIDVNVYTSGVDSLKKLYYQRLRWNKGFIDNVSRYKHLFSRKYGNFGVFILPTSVLVILVATSMTIYGLLQVLKNGINFIKTLILYEFNLKKIFEWNFDPYFINIDAIVIVTILLTIIGFIFLMLSQKHTEEKQPWISAFFYFMLSYSLIFTFLWISTFIHKLRGKKIKWGNRNF